MRGQLAAAPNATAVVSAGGLFALTGFLGLQPLATDLYLPSLPAIGRHFGETPAAVQATLSAFIAAFAFAQLLVGPLSDRFGRRPVALGGLALFLLASIAASAAPSLGWLVAMRVAQAAGVCCTVLCARAIVRDLYEPDAGTRVMARALGWMTVITLLGPVTGGLLQSAFGWRAAFVALSAVALVLLANAAIGLPETNRHRDRNATRPGPLVANYLTIARDPVFRAFALTATGSYCGLFAFISGSSFVLIEVLGLSPAGYGLAFGLVTLGFLPGTLLTRRLQPVLGVRRTAALGGAIAAAGGLTMAGLALAGVQSVAAIVAPMFVVLLAHGLLQPTCQMGALADFPRNAGAAAALLGFAMHLVAAALGAWIGASHDGTTLPLAATIGTIACLTALSSLRLLRAWPRSS